MMIMGCLPLTRADMGRLPLLFSCPDDPDPDDGFNYKQMMVRDERRFKMADKDGDLTATKEEFTAFLHPEEYDYMKDIVVQVGLLRPAARPQTWSSWQRNGWRSLEIRVDGGDPLEPLRRRHQEWSGGGMTWSRSGGSEDGCGWRGWTVEHKTVGLGFFLTWR